MTIFAVSRKWLAAVLAVTPAFAFAAEVPRPCGPDPRERCVAYSQGQIVRLFAAPGATLTIEFPAAEKVFFTGVSDNQLIAGTGAPAERVSTGQDSTGDPNLMIWVPGAPDAPQQFLTIKPLRHLETQPLLVLTWWTDPSGQKQIRRHTFELRTRAGDLSENSPDTFFSVKFLDPAGERAVVSARAEAARDTRQAEIAAARLQTAVHSIRRNKLYDAQGLPRDRALAPVEAWDDGERTYLRYAGNQRTPIAYQILPDGKEGVVGQSAEPDPSANGNILIVQTVAASLRLRDGDNVLCVFNRAYDQTGHNTGTGTVSRNVYRQVRRRVR